MTKHPDVAAKLDNFPPIDLPRGAKPFRRRPARGQGVDVLVEDLAPNVWSTHRHNAWQIVIIFSPGICDVSWRVPSGGLTRRRLNGGEVWILPPGWMHGGRWREYADVIVLYICPAHIERYCPKLLRESSVVSLTHYVSALTVVAELALELRQFASAQNGATDWRVAGIGTHLAAVLVQAHLRLTKGGVKPLNGLEERILERVKTYAEDRKRERVAVGAMARALGISARHLRRVFRRLTGKSPQEWVTAEKAARAKALLLGGHSPKETVDASGFTDTRHLRRVLRMCYGVAPSAFRAASPRHP